MAIFGIAYGVVFKTHYLNILKSQKITYFGQNYIFFLNPYKWGSLTTSDKQGPPGNKEGFKVLII